MIRRTLSALWRPFDAALFALGLLLLVPLGLLFFWWLGPLCVSCRHAAPLPGSDCCAGCRT